MASGDVLIQVTSMGVSDIESHYASLTDTFTMTLFGGNTAVAPTGFTLGADVPVVLRSVGNASDATSPIDGTKKYTLTITEV